MKGSARKLLSAAQLPSFYWPLAALHASNRHWVLLAECLGIAQPTLLPFGMKLHARRRFTTGFDFHWRSRAVLGTYLGQAPNTPGGHVVLVPDDKEDFKVLLTNTVCPLRSHASGSGPKPKLRLRTKTSPDLVVKLVQAWPVHCSSAIDSCKASRSVPGGEWVFGSAKSEGSSVDSGTVEDQVGVLGSRVLKQMSKALRLHGGLQTPSSSQSGALSEQQAGMNGGSFAPKQQQGLQTPSSSQSGALSEQQAVMKDGSLAPKEQHVVEGKSRCALEKQQTPCRGRAVRFRSSTPH